ncbi:excalibur calcium-binding domain-containing protein [Agarivorans aestuarii]|uniref:excalibur calcium-binding domain-containing protein n=1 Tax=Agarivorans aestuarii TaxID=1563703 RepID=UPI001C816012|nr:excalibur calcium-binding domain-containing protein [Agarivorans aestuarii]
METGVLKKWDDAKGFGFISVTGKPNDVFIHISSLKLMPRKPQVGDTILFQIEHQPNGKTKAYNCSIQGLTPISFAKSYSHSPQRERVSQKRPSVLAKLIPVLTVIGAVFLYQTFAPQYLNTESASHIPNIESSALDSSSSFSTSSNFSCEGKTHCSQMVSCEEAKFYLANCPNTKMDGDRDGVPCERQHCTSNW